VSLSAGFDRAAAVLPAGFTGTLSAAKRLLFAAAIKL
jgi:hypothetical protein